MILACGHDRTPFGSPLCSHLRTCREAWLEYLRWYTGSGLEMELLCRACCDAREAGVSVTVERVCQECFGFATSEVGDLVGARGTPEIRTRTELFEAVPRRTAIPAAAGSVIDLAPVESDGRPLWILLAADGTLTRFNADTGEWAHVGRADVDPEPGHQPWCGHVLQRRLHASAAGEFAAVVNDYGRHGQIIDLRSGRVTLALDGGTYHSATVPFSFAFAEVQGRVVAVHRTAWNRLDISDPSNGSRLTDRSPTSYRQGEQRPEHYLDYFHGALHVSPGGAWIVDDGWVWHPVGIPMSWNLEKWLTENVWESEDGSSMQTLCCRDYYWGRAMVWLDERRVAVGGIGEDDQWMIAGARVFDVTQSHEEAGQRVRGPLARELIAFPGPAGLFFSEGKWLYSSDETGLSRWDPEEGVRTGHLQGFCPTRHHRTAGELVQLDGSVLARCNIKA